MIKVLDKFIADKIAAGEVIERPVSAVKELVENSIDAGAKSIIVEIRGGGKTYIRVTDDGCGISPEEAETAFLRHATSKISSVNDLDSITTLGFRGEALASIAAVSKLTIVTKTHDRTAGIRIMMHGGRVIAKETAGANPGTTIVVEDLFYNTPARRKFMGTDAREGGAVIELIQQYAVCYPDIRFMMIRNGETVISTAGDGDALAAIRSLYPDSAHAELIPAEGDRVKGFVSDPGTTKNNRKGQLFFVNGRLVDSKVIEKGLETGYGGRVFSGYPVAILFIDADPSQIDVNIHPGKREIRFLDPSGITSDIASAVNRAMLSRESVPSGIKPEPAPMVPDDLTIVHQPDIQHSDNTFYTADPLNNEAQAADTASMQETIPGGEQSSIREYLGSLRRIGSSYPTEESPESGHTDYSASRISDSSHPLYDASHLSDSGSTIYNAASASHISGPFSFDELEYRGYLFSTYIVMQSEDTVYLFDQHAAHERIFYEKFREHYLKSDKLTQPILTPVTINVSADVYYMSREWLEPLASAGYDIEDFGDRTFMIRGIPSFMELSEAESFARAYLEELGEASGINSTVIDKLIMKSCKSAVKAGEHLSQHEIEELMRELAACSNPYCCPHGRPTFIRYRKYEIERSFRRK